MSKVANQKNDKKEIEIEEGASSKVLLQKNNSIDQNYENINNDEINNKEQLDSKNKNSDDDKTVKNDIELSQDIVNEKIDAAMQSLSPKKRKRSIIISLVFLLINIIFMTFIIKSLLGNIEENNLSEILKNRGNNIWWLAGGLAIYVFYVFVQVLMYYILIKNFTGKKRIGLAYDVAVVGKYYDNVTPFAVGGQPMQIVRLATNGVSAGISTSIPTIKMLIISFLNMVLSLFFFIFGLPLIPATKTLNVILLTIFEILGVIGLVINGVITLSLIMLSTGNFVTRSFISGILRIGYKLKLVKNYRQSLKKIINQVAEYRASMKYLIKNKKMFLKLLLLGLCECLSFAALPYFVVRAFASGTDTMTLEFFIVCLVKYYIVAMASSYIPLPGGTGMAEISFIFLFGIMVNNYIVWVLLAYRILSYYLILAHGFTHELGKIGRNLIRNKKQLNAN